MSEHSFLILDGDRVCTVTLTDIQGDALADEAREVLLAEFEEA